MTLYLVPDLVTALDNTIDPTAHTNLSLVQVAGVIVGVFLPILVGLIVKQSWPSAWKAWLLAFLSGVTGFLTEFINSGDFVWQQALLTSIVTFVTAGAFYHNLWKPSGVTAKAQAMLNKDAA